MVEISKETFNELVQNPNTISLDQSIALKNIIKKYPFFQVARVIELIGLKKFNNIELLHDWSIDMGLEFLGLNGGLIQFDINKLSSKKEESFKDFLWEDASWFTQFAKKLHYKNPGKCKIFVKKSWLDNSSKLIFKNLETISFHYIGKKIFYSVESYFKDKIFLFPVFIIAKAPVPYVLLTDPFSKQVCPTAAAC